MTVPDGLCKDETSISTPCLDGSRHVGFVEEYENRVYDSEYYREDLRERWYSRKEIAQFRQDVRDETESILVSDNKPTHLRWFLSLLAACMKIKNETIIQAVIDPVLQICRISMDDPDLLGMERWVIHPWFDKRRSTRIRVMTDRICYSSSRWVHFHERTSREASRPDRWLAYLLARMHAEATHRE